MEKNALARWDLEEREILLQALFLVRFFFRLAGIDGVEIITFS